MTDERNKPDPAPAISPELVDRMVELIRDLRASHERNSQFTTCDPHDFIGRTKAILAELDSPEVDPLLVEARRMCANSTGCIQSKDAYLRGTWDATVSMKATLAALKRGMELAKEQGA